MYTSTLQVLAEGRTYQISTVAHKKFGTLHHNGKSRFSKYMKSVNEQQTTAAFFGTRVNWYAGIN